MSEVTVINKATVELIIDLTLTMETPLSVGAGGSAGSIANKTIVRNQRGQLLLPGSQLKGRLRHACEVLARTAGVPICQAPRGEAMCPNLPETPAPCPICQLFGSPAYPGRLFFSDLLDESPPALPAIRPGNSVNRRRRMVEEQRLFFVETSPPGALVCLQNSAAITGCLHTKQAVAQGKLLVAGLAFLQNWGGGKSRGLGWGKITPKAWVNGVLIKAVDMADVEEAIRNLR